MLNESLNNMGQQKEKIEADKERLRISEELGIIIVAKGIAENKDWEKQANYIIKEIGDDKNINVRKSNPEGSAIDNYQVLKELLRIFISSGRTKDANKLYSIYQSTFYGS